MHRTSSVVQVVLFELAVRNCPNSCSPRATESRARIRLCPAQTNPVVFPLERLQVCLTVWVVKRNVPIAVGVFLHTNGELIRLLFEHTHTRTNYKKATLETRAVPYTGSTPPPSLSAAS